jgi:hypothetical protein
MKHLLHMFLVLASLSLCCNAAEPPYVQAIPPLVRVPGQGLSFLIPDESGWMFFDPDGKGSTIVKFGQSELESYVIALDVYDQNSEKTAQEFRELYEILKKRELAGPRYAPRDVVDQFNASKDKPWIDFYYLVEDHEAIRLPQGQDFMLMESMGYFAINPHEPNVIVRVSYSYRYSPGHEDGNFKDKAKWVLDRATFTER